MQPDNRRYLWIGAVILILLAVGAVAFGLGIAASNHRLFAATPMRVYGYGLRGEGFGLAGLLLPLLLLGLGVLLIVLLVRALDHRDPAPPTSGPGISEPPAPSAPPAAADGIDRLHDLASMHEKGQLTDEEFTAAKRRILGL
jgi:hypothetical protein